MPGVGAAAARRRSCGQSRRCAAAGRRWRPGCRRRRPPPRRSRPARRAPGAAAHEQGQHLLLVVHRDDDGQLGTCAQPTAEGVADCRAPWRGCGRSARVGPRVATVARGRARGHARGGGRTGSPAVGWPHVCSGPPRSPPLRKPPPLPMPVTPSASSRSWCSSLLLGVTWSFRTPPPSPARRDVGCRRRRVRRPLPAPARYPTPRTPTDHAARGHGWHLRPHPPRPPRRGERGAALFDLDEVVFVPTGQPWQKADRRSRRPRTATS